MLLCIRLISHQFKFFSVGLLALSIALLSTACGSFKTTSQSIGTVPAGNAQLDAQTENKRNFDSDAESDAGGAAVSACISTECEQSVSPRLLSAEELAMIESELGLDEKVVDSQSFVIQLPIKGMATLVTTEKDAGEFLLSLRMGQNEYASVYQSYGQHPSKIQTLAFEDIHQDGDGPDIVVIARYDPENSAAPFMKAHVLFNRGDDTFQQDIAVDQILSERHITTVSEAIDIARTEGLVRGLQYREGPP